MHLLRIIARSIKRNCSPTLRPRLANAAGQSCHVVGQSSRRLRQLATWCTTTAKTLLCLCNLNRWRTRSSTRQDESNSVPSRAFGSLLLPHLWSGRASLRRNPCRQASTRPHAGHTLHDNGEWEVINSPRPCSPVVANTTPRHDFVTHGPWTALESERCVHCKALALTPLPSQFGVYETTHLRLPHLEPTHSRGRHDPPRRLHREHRPTPGRTIALHETTQRGNVDARHSACNTVARTGRLRHSWTTEVAKPGPQSLDLLRWDRLPVDLHYDVLGACTV